MRPVQKVVLLATFAATLAAIAFPAWERRWVDLVTRSGTVTGRRGEKMQDYCRAPLWSGPAAPAPWTEERESPFDRERVRHVHSAADLETTPHLARTLLEVFGVLIVGAGVVVALHRTR